MPNFTMPVVMGQLAAGNQALSQLDTDYDAVARMGTYMCSSTGTNAYTLTKLANYPTMTAYGNTQKIGFVANATSTSAVTIAVSPLGTLNAYRNDGTTQLTAGDIVAGSYYELAYNSTLNSNAGGFQRISANSGTFNLVAFSFTASSTYTPTSGMQYCLIEMCGGGGGGGSVAGASNVAGGGGGGGGYLYARLTAAQIGASRSVTVGGAGAGGATGANNAGAAGGLSSVTGLLGCTGGAGGVAGGSLVSGGVGGAGTVGTGTQIFAEVGGTGGVGAGTAALSFGGAGGGNPLGSFAQQTLSITGNGVNGSVASGYGAGGAGAANCGGTTQPGGAGSAGIITIIEFCTT